MATEFYTPDFSKVLHDGLSTTSANQDPKQRYFAQVAYGFGTFVSKNGRAPLYVINRRHAKTTEFTDQLDVAGLASDDEFCRIQRLDPDLVEKARKAAEAVDQIRSAEAELDSTLDAILEDIDEH